MPPDRDPSRAVQKRPCSIEVDQPSWPAISKWKHFVLKVNGLPQRAARDTAIAPGSILRYVVGLP